jgi:hypothetical protein
MQTVVGDLWSFSGWKVVPTNTSYDRLERAVSGRGVALQAAIKYPGFRSRLGRLLKNTDRAAIVHVFPDLSLICLPVKRKWMDKASLTLIEAGVASLVEITDVTKEQIYLPLLGCGFGELDEQPVMGILNRYLNDNFTLVLRDASVLEKYPESFVGGIRRDRSLEKESGYAVDQRPRCE